MGLRAFECFQQVLIVQFETGAQQGPLTSAVVGLKSYERFLSSPVNLARSHIMNIAHTISC